MWAEMGAGGLLPKGKAEICYQQNNKWTDAGQQKQNHKTITGGFLARNVFVIRFVIKDIPSNNPHCCGNVEKGCWEIQMLGGA